MAFQSSIAVWKLLPWRCRQKFVIEPRTLSAAVVRESSNFASLQLNNRKDRSTSSSSVLQFIPCSCGFKMLPRNVRALVNSENWLKFDTGARWSRYWVFSYPQGVLKITNFVVSVLLFQVQTVNNKKSSGRNIDNSQVIVKSRLEVWHKVYVQRSHKWWPGLRGKQSFNGAAHA